MTEKNESETEVSQGFLVRIHPSILKNLIEVRGGWVSARGYGRKPVIKIISDDSDERNIEEYKDIPAIVVFTRDDERYVLRLYIKKDEEIREEEKEKGLRYLICLNEFSIKIPEPCRVFTFPLNSDIQYAVIKREFSELIEGMWKKEEDKTSERGGSFRFESDIVPHLDFLKSLNEMGYEIEINSDEKIITLKKEGIFRVKKVIMEIDDERCICNIPENKYELYAKDITVRCSYDREMITISQITAEGSNHPNFDGRSFCKGERDEKNNLKTYFSEGRDRLIELIETANYTSAYRRILEEEIIENEEIFIKINSI